MLHIYILRLFVVTHDSHRGSLVRVRLPGHSVQEALACLPNARHISIISVSVAK